MVRYMGCALCGHSEWSYKADAWFSKKGEFVEKGTDAPTDYYCEGCKRTTNVKPCGSYHDDNGDGAAVPGVREQQGD